MPSILHIVSQPEDALARELIQKQTAQPENQVEVVDLTVGEPDYKALLQKVFAADSVQVW